MADPQKDRREHNAQIDAVAAELAAERATFEPDIGKVLSHEPISPWIVDAGIYTSRRDREAIQREEDRITRLERLGR